MNKLLGILLLAITFTATAGETATASSNTATATNSTETSAVAVNSGSGNGNSLGDVNPTAISTGSGNGNQVTFTSPGQTRQDVHYSGSQTIKNTPSVNGPSLTTSNDTCMGSTSGSFNIAGLGIGGGSTWTDNNCKRLKNSRELWNMGMKAASLALLCNDPENREALEVTGYQCPETPTTRKQKEQQSASNTGFVNPLGR